MNNFQTRCCNLTLKVEINVVACRFYFEKEIYNQQKITAAVAGDAAVSTQPKWVEFSDEVLNSTLNIA
jgi:hypothetical protein